MATVSMARAVGATGTSPRALDNSAMPVRLWAEVDLAAAATAKGSALAAADVIEVLRIPANSQILAAGARKTAASAGTATDVTFDIGITGVDADIFVDGWDFDGAAVGSYGTPAGVQTPELIVSTSDTIDILIATQTGTLTAGKVLVWAVVVDLEVEGRGAIAQPKS